MSPIRTVVRYGSYMLQHWAYIALSRVRAFKELFICETLEETKYGKVDQEPFEEEEISLHIEINWTTFLNM